MIAQGSVVQILSTSETGMVMEVMPLGQDQRLHYKIFVNPMRCPTVPATDVRLVGEAGATSLAGKVQNRQFRPWRQVSAHLTLQKLQTPLTDLLYSFLSSRTEFMPHQFIPMVKLLNSANHRLLIADEVGLGKTIESGIVLSELKSRGEFKRCLVVCQGHLLMRKWQEEMQARFDERFDLLDRAGVDRFLKDCEEDQDPPLRAVCSLPMLRQQALRERLAAVAPTFDLVIVDEAHRLRNAHTDSYALGEVLSELAHVLLFLTATPLQIGNEDLFHLLRLLSPGDFGNFDHFADLIRPNEQLNLALRMVQSGNAFSREEVLQQLKRMADRDYFNRLRRDPVYQRVVGQLQAQADWTPADRVDLERELTRLNPLSFIFTRTRRRETTVKFARRSAVRLAVDLTAEESGFLQGVEALGEAMNEVSNFEHGSSFGVQMLRRQAASCLPATVSYLDDILSGAGIPTDETDEWEEEPTATSFVLHPSCVGQAKAALEQGRRLGDRDSKYEAFAGQLRTQQERGAGKVLVFSYFKRTLRHLKRRLLRDGFATFLLSGDLPYDERELVIEDFRQHEGMAVLLSSEVGGEGLDFQFADTLFNYDLPWNPMVVEQRIGRIDRFGQKSDKVLIFNLSVPGTIEERIFERLYNRIQIFERSIGDLEAILGEEIGKLTQDVLHYRLTPEEEARRVDEVARAIRKREQQLEELEKNAARFSGSNGVFMRQIEEVRTGRKYLQERDLVGLVQAFLEERVHGCSLDRTRKGTWTLSQPREFCSVVRGLPGASEPHSHRQFLARLADAAPVHLAFSADVANADRRSEFVTPRHPLVRLLLESYRTQAPPGGPPVGSVSVEDEQAPLGEFLVPVFLVHLKSFREDVSLQFVPVDLEKAAFSQALAERLETLLAGETVRDTLPGDSGEWESRVEAAARRAQDRLVDDLEARKNALLEENNRMIQLRLDSLERTWKVQNERLQEILRKQLPESIRKMKVREQDNLRDRYDRERARLEERRTASYSHDLVGMFVLKVRRPGRTRSPPDEESTQDPSPPPENPPGMTEGKGVDATIPPEEEPGPAWQVHLPAALRLDQPLPNVRHWLAERLRAHPAAAARLPLFRRVPRLGADGLAFRVPPPGEVDAVLAPEDGGWTVLLREGLDPRDEVRLFLHAFAHRLLGHARDGDAHAHWDRLNDATRRWDREADELLQIPEEYRQPPPGAARAEESRALDEAARLPLIEFLEDLPNLDARVPFAPDLLPFRPWPHQVHVASEILDHFPCRRLLCDEVGLGKTIETGLALRELVHRGLVRRCLLLVPAGVQTQWREELAEKFNLHFQPLPEGGDPWAGEHLLRLASSHLARRRERLGGLLQAEPWDLVVVDEAHHARRGADERPNRMLALLQGLARRTRGLLLLTATPLQLRLREVADLLALLGETGDLERHFELLAGPLTADTWRELRPHLVAGNLEREERAWRRRFGGPLPRRVVHLLEGREGAEGRLGELAPAEVEAVRTLLRRRTPLQRRMFRHTRALLRQYRAAGLLDQNIPERDLEDRFVPLSAAERDVYDRLEEHFREVSAEARRLLGHDAVRVDFLLDLYRRRLTSSLGAIALSLGRRAARLAAVLGRRPEEVHPALADLPCPATEEPEEEWDDEDRLALEETEAPPEQAALARAELAGLARLAPRLRELLDRNEDSKRERFLDDLRRLLDRHDKVLVFTQFTDTMDGLREAVQPMFRPGAVACYSGRGGEVWRDGRWQPTTKEEIKARFRAPRDLQVLLCTDAASEGLNFQTCGVLVNYDMPWNPMRAEQRIGRIDRIGQQHAVIEIRNYYYEDSIEGRVYRRLEERIGLFHEVVGPLQPILAAVTDRLREAARAGGARGQALADAAVADLEARAGEERETAPLIDPDLEDPELPAPPAPPSTVRPAELARLLPDPGPGATFDPAVAEEQGLRLATPGGPDWSPV